MREQATPLHDDSTIEDDDGVHILTKEDMDAAHPYTYRVWWSAEDEAYLAATEELPEVLSHGDTEAGALEMAHEAAATALWARRELGHPIPPATHGQRVSMANR